MNLEALELKAVTAVQALRLRCEELSADVERLTAENKGLKVNLRQAHDDFKLAQRHGVDRQAKKGKGVAALFPDPEPTPTPSAPGLAKLTLTEKILLCLFRVEEPLTKLQVCFYTGMSPASGPMTKAYAEGLRQDWIEKQNGPAGAFAITESGVEHLADLNLHSPPLPPGHQVYEEFCKREGGMVATMGRAMLAIAREHGFAAPQSRADVAHFATVHLGRPVSSASGPATKAFARLMKLGVIQGKGKGHTFSPWIVGMLEPISVKVRDTSTGAERRVVVK